MARKLASDKVAVDLALLGETAHLEGDWAIVVSGTREGSATRMDSAFIGSADRMALAEMAKGACRLVRQVAGRMEVPAVVIMAVMSAAAAREARRDGDRDGVRVEDLAARAEEVEVYADL